MRIQEQAPSQQLIDRVRRRFEQNRAAQSNSKCQLGFEEFLTAFQNDCETFADIGARAGVSREMVRQIYKKYFAELFPHRPDGLRRRKMCTLKRHRDVVQTATLNGWKNVITDTARAEGLSVRRVQTKGGIGPASNRLRINGKLSVSFYTTSIFHPRGSRRGYSRAVLTRSTIISVRFVVILQELPGCEKKIWIIPSEILLQDWPQDKRRHTFYLPVDDTSRQSDNPHKINWQQYDNAWDLLR